MKMQTITTNAAPNVHVSPVPGDLRVAGWDRNELMAKTDGDMLDLVPGSDPIIISCDEDLILYLPRGASLKVENVAGDASLQALGGALDLGNVAGDLSLHDIGRTMLESVTGDASMRNVSGLNARAVSGDLTLRNCTGDCIVDSIGGDASIRDVNGTVQIASVGSDLYLRKADGPINVNAGADVILFLDPHAGQEYRASAGDDLLLRLPPEASATLHLVAGSPESIQVNFPGIALEPESEVIDFAVGNGEAQIYITAGDDLVITSQADQWESAADFGVDMSDGNLWGIPPIPPIPPLPPDFSERINRRVQAALERSQSHIEAAGRRAEAAGRKAEATMRRAEAKARAAEVRARRGWKVDYVPQSGKPSADLNVGRWHWDLTPQGTAESGEPVSDEERLTILRMLQEKKISLEEAEKLLAAIEGK
jgi:hypothetical protein